MTKDKLQMEVMRLAEKANQMVKSGELSKFQAGFYLREAVAKGLRLPYEG